MNRNPNGQFAQSLPRYSDGRQTFLELHSHQTAWKLENEDKTDEEFNFLVDVATEAFESKTGITLYRLGRSGRHICVEDNSENSKNYRTLERLALKLEEWVVRSFNKKDSLTN